MKKFFAVMLLAMTLIFVKGSVVTAQELNFVPLDAGAAYDGVVDRNIDYLALRSGPSVHYDEIMRIPPGARVMVVVSDSISGNFVRVKYRGVWGYSHRRYITRVSDYY